MAVENLKRSVGQGKIYIRPIQSSLSILPLKGSATVQTSSLKERCMKCGELFSISLLRDHLLSCSVDNNSSDSSESDNETQEYVVTANSEEVNTGTDAPSLAPATTHDPPDDEMKDNETQEDVVTANNEEMNTTGTDTPSLATPRDPPDEFANSAFQIEFVAREALIPLIQDHQVEMIDINNVVQKFIIDNSEEVNPVELLRKMQKSFVNGRALEVTNPEIDLVGDTNFIMVDRGKNLLQSAFEELSNIRNKSLTLEVQFYGEVWK